MRSRAIETLAVAGLAAIVTAIIAMPVLLAPSERIFGMPIAGHHHDPFTFMRQIAGPIVPGVYLQPATDVPAALIARGTGPIAAYNVLVLLSFPLAAAAAYLLARHFEIGPRWAAAAALAFAFSPFHVSHAAYHPHIAQTFWVPLYLLALWRCMDRPAPASMAMLGVSVAGVTLSNFYGGLIAAVMTPAALLAYWYFMARLAPRALTRAAVTALSLAAIALLGVAYVLLAAPDLVANAGRYAAAPDDLVRYGARWWSYVTLPAAHPAAGSFVERFWHASGVDVGMLEQQLTLGWAVLGLALVAAIPSARRSRVASSRVLLLASVAAVAFVWSLAGGPGALLHSLLPMFRSYARFGIVVHLMAVLLAAMGAERLWHSQRAHARAICGVLLACVVAEYAVWPPWMTRDVLPTGAHRWIASQPAGARVLDCVPGGVEADSIRWLTGNRVTAYAAPFVDCTDPDLPVRLATAGYTHLLIRRRTPEGEWVAGRRTPEGLQRAAHFTDSDLYAVAALPEVRP